MGFIKNTILLSLGLMNVSKEKAKSIYEELLKEGEKKKEESDFLKKNWERIEHLEDNICEIPKLITKKVFIETTNIIDAFKKRLKDIKET
uniref:Uncharacterized protein n=1 Tax=candidate division WOR-3 bacterium TaxID=2052148 RepID=A0A7C4Y4M4_UNCW3